MLRKNSTLVSLLHLSTRSSRAPRVDAHNHCVVSLERLQRKLLLGLDALFPKLDNLAREDLLRRRCAVDTVRLDGDHDTAANLQELMRIETDDTCLIWLCNVGEDAVDHADEHAVLERVPGVFDDRDDVCAVCGHVDQIAAGAVGEFDSEDCAGRANDIGDVGDGSARCSTEIENLAARLHVYVLKTTKDTGCQLGAERVPDAVLGLGCDGCIAVRGVAGDGTRCVDGYALLAIDGLTRCQVLGDQQIFLAACDKDAGVSVRLLYTTVSPYVSVSLASLWHVR